METLAFGTLMFLVSKVIEFLKYLRAKDWNGAFTLGSVWVGGIVVTWIAAGSKIMEAIVLPGASLPLGDLDSSSKILIGMTLTSIGAKVYDFQKAFDNTDSARQPQLTSLSSGNEGDGKPLPDSGYTTLVNVLVVLGIIVLAIWLLRALV